MLPQKRPQPDAGCHLPKLSEIEHKLYGVIKSKEGAGIWTSDLKKVVIGYTQNAITKALNSLKAKNLVKEVSSVKHKSRKIVMGVEFEPSDEISGGTWYQQGALDVELVQILRQQCAKHVQNLRVATCEKIREAIRASSVFKMDITLQQISEIVELMVLDKELERVRSTGVGDFSSVPAGRECYRISKGREGPKGGVFSSIPCGVCPRISECTPDGLISPTNCVYYSKWLGLDF